MKEIPVLGGGVVQVLDLHYDLLRHFKWQRCGFCGHVFRNVRRDEQGDYTIYIEAEIMGTETISVHGACNPCPAVRE